MTTAHPIPTAPPTAGRPTGGPVVGLLLVVPMLLATIVCIAWPSVTTLVRATTATQGPIGGDSGPAEWGTVLSSAGGLAVAGLGTVLPTIVIGVLLAVPVAQALALGQLAARIGVAVLVVAPMPLAAATWWVLGAGEIGPSGALGAFAAGALPTIVGVAAIVLVPVVRAGMRPVPVLLAAAAVGAATAALALQSSLTSAFAGGAASTLPSQSYELAFLRLDLADAAGYDLLVLVALGVVGVAVVALLAVLRPAIVIAPTTAGRPLAATIGALVAIVVAVGAVAMPALLAASGATPQRLSDALLPAVVGTWVPALVAAAVATALAAAAAIGIGWLRPLGRHSLWLLLPFAPALLVTATPLAASALLDRVALGAGTLPLLPTVVVSVPLLVALTLLASGMRHAGRLDARTLAWVALAGFAVLAVLHAQSLMPARVLAMPEDSSIVLQLQAIGTFSGAGAAVGIAALATALPVALLLAPIVVLGLGALRGATLVVGDEPLPAGPTAEPHPATLQPAPPPPMGSWQPGAQPPPPAPGTQVPPPGWPPPQP